MRLPVFLALISSPLGIWPLPQGCRVVSGDAEISSDASQMHIRSNQKTILEWNQFSIDFGELAVFDQKGAILNRVIGGDSSSLLGTLSANGSIYLINPNGVLIGPGAKIEAASFIASTLDVLNADFLNDHLLFTGTTGAIINLGQIVCPSGTVALIGRQVKNGGRIHAEEGHAALISGMEVLLQLEGDQRVFVRPQAIEEAPQEGAAVENSGSIKALAVDLMAGESLYAKAVQSSGAINATSVVETGGRVYLVAESGVSEISGLIDASNFMGTGGEVRVLGKDVRLLNGSKIDASGKLGGGQVLVGGDYQGKNQEIPNAKTLWMSKDASIAADAITQGDGGKVILWSDESTRMHGSISARGGRSGGDGGFVEVSGKYLDFQGVVDRRAPMGKAGKLLLDPTNIQITADDSANINNPGGGGDYTFNDCSPTPATISATGLTTNLNLGSVTISTSATVGGDPNACGDVGTIEILSSIGAGNTWTEPTTLTLFADANIVFNDGVSITNTSASTGFDAVVMVASGTGATGIGINFLGTVTTNGGNVTVFGTATSNTASSHGISIAGSGKITTTTGDIFVAGSVASPSTSNSAVGVSFSSASPLVSTSGNIFVSAHNQAVGTSGNHGVLITSAWTTGTIGTLTFGNTINNPIPAALPASITGCQGGGGNSSRGINLTAAFSTRGSVIATNSIIGGTGSGGGGFSTISTFSSSSGGIIAITASAQNSGVTLSSGISLSGSTLSTTGAGTITLIGIGTPVPGPTSRGIDLSNAVITNAAGTGAIQLAGITPSGANAGTGVGLGGSTLTANGPIHISGVSQASGNIHGVSFLSTGITTGGVGTLTFGSTISDGTVSVTGCQGSGTGAGINQQTGANIIAAGGIVATNSILGGTGNSAYGYASSARMTSAGGGSIFITASAGTVGANIGAGIQLSGPAEISTSGSGEIRLIGLASPLAGSSSSFGVRINGGVVTTTGSGAISIAGMVPAVTAVGTGVQITASNVVTSPGGGPINISGTSSSTLNNSHGVSITGAWSTLTSGTVTFGSTITDGVTSITGCRGGGGNTSHGINLTNTFSTLGSVIATNSIIGGTGTGCHGFSTNSSFSSSSGGFIAITASTQATGATASNGINLSGGTLSTTGAGTITLIGTASGANTGASRGVSISGAATIAANTGAINIAGNVPVGATGSAVGVNISVDNAITSSGNGLINISGTSAASGSGSHGVSVANTWTTGTSGAVTFGSAISDGTTSITGCHGGSGTGSHGLNFANVFSTTGSVVATNSIVAGSGPDSYGFAASSSFSSTGTGDIAIAASTNGGASSSPIALASTMSANNGSIDLNGAVLLLGSTVLNSLTGTIAVDGTVTGNSNFTSSSALDSTFSDTINTSGASNGAEVSLTSSSGSIYFSSIDTQGTSGAGGNVTIASSGAFSSVGTINAAGGVSDGTIVIDNSLTADTGSITIFGNVALTNTALTLSTSATGGDISITGPVAGEEPFTIDSGGAISVSGDIDLSGSVGSNFLAQAIGNIAVANIDTSGSVGAGGDISLLSSPVVSDTPLGALPSSIIQFGGTSIDASGATIGGTITLGSGRTSGASIATIANTSGNNLLIQGGIFNMEGPYEAMTILGDLTMNLTGVATLSDIVTLGNLSITAPSIILQAKDPIIILSSVRVLYTSPSSHIFSGGAQMFSSPPVSNGGIVSSLSLASSNLIYTPDNFILNFYRDITLNPPSISSTIPSIVYLFAVANTQMFDLLPFIGAYWQECYLPLFCDQDLAVCRKQALFQFLSFLIQNRVLE